MNKNVNTTVAEGVAEIELDRRDKKNALDAAMYRALAEALQQADAQADVRVILLRGQADLFCAGNDLREFLDPEGAGTRPALALMDAVQALRKPVIAAVGGAAVGLGTTLLFHCDVVYATPQARFGMPFVPLGVCPEFGTSQLAALAAGHRIASEAILFGELFDVETARELGLVNRVVEAGLLLAFARERAQKLARLPPAAVLNAKAMLKRRSFAGMPELFREELKTFDAMLAQTEARDAIGAFLGRR